MSYDTREKNKTGIKRSRKKDKKKNSEILPEKNMVQCPVAEAIQPEELAKAPQLPQAENISIEKKSAIQAVGLIETIGLIPAIGAADAMCKAADVCLKGIEKSGNGLVTVKVRGDVSSVKASVSSGRAAVEGLGQIVSVHVIPRPSEQTENIL